MQRLAAAVAGPQPAEARGVLLANPSSFSRRMCLELPGTPALPTVVDVPPLGFAWIAPESAAPPPPPRAKWSLLGRRPKAEPALVRHEPGHTPGTRQTVLRNEFFTVVIDEQSGAIRSISDDLTRGPRLAQQLAMRLAPHAAGAADEAAYSIMAADEVKIVSAGPVLGEVAVRGRLMARDGPRLAGFQQTTRIWRGSRVIELLIELEPERMPEADPWNSYYAARFAWLDPTARFYRGANLATVPTEAVQIESPHFVDVRTEKTRTTLLAGGLPYHRRCGPRKLDTLLLVRGETARRFRLGIALEAPNPLSAALDFLAPAAMLADAPRPGRSSGWLFHLDVRGVVATHWELLSDGPAGFRVRLLETDGRGGAVESAFVPRVGVRREAQPERRAGGAVAGRGRPPVRWTCGPTSGRKWRRCSRRRAEGGKGKGETPSPPAAAGGNWRRERRFLRITSRRAQPAGVGSAWSASATRGPRLFLLDPDHDAFVWVRGPHVQQVAGGKRFSTALYVALAIAPEVHRARPLCCVPSEHGRILPLPRS